ncbi:MAG TPA: type I glyceraldehyde-3-phosphate dehydrogenase [Polyangiales bacterium]|jgi:glyceraldehyde 3-phosphate dehydrogenase|nr:type I glyceraldehyde-3-phosphate dehydrogenase [Polyangiales bacterium]
MATKIAINGFGRIGRCIARVLLGQGESDVEIVGINDLTSADVLAHLLAFDSVHGRFNKPVVAKDGALVIGDTRIPVFAEKDPAKLPWKSVGASIVIESTGLFTNRDGAQKHIDAGAQRVIISAPGGSDIDGTFCMGINSAGYDPAKHKIVSNASCTTNCLAPIAKVVHEKFGILKGHMVTVHSYTNDQRVLDLPHKDLRRARAAALSMIPTSTGAAKAIGLVLPELKGKLDGTSIRVPTPNVSLVCLTAHVSKKTSRDEVNAALKDASVGALKGVLAFEERPLVSHDFIGDPHSSIVDAAQTQVIGDDLVEIQSWYDNEWGFSNRMVDLARLMASKG